MKTIRKKNQNKSKKTVHVFLLKRIWTENIALQMNTYTVVNENPSLSFDIYIYYFSTCINNHLHLGKLYKGHNYIWLNVSTSIGTSYYHYIRRRRWAFHKFVLHHLRINIYLIILLSSVTCLKNQTKNLKFFLSFIIICMRVICGAKYLSNSMYSVFVMNLMACLLTIGYLI